MSKMAQTIQDKYLSPTENVDVSKKEFAKLNFLAGSIYTILMLLQMSINTISLAIKCADVIDRRYEETVTDIHVLSRFVDKMIDSGIPPRYVAFNVFKVCSKSIKGSGNPNEPIWGQTRMVLFPMSTSGTVYKISVNSIGRNSNAAEANYWKRVSSTEYAKYFARVYDLTEDHCVESMERVKTFKNTDPTGWSRANLVRSVCEKITSELNLPNVAGDLHPLNVGERDGTPVAIDYGYIGSMVTAREAKPTLWKKAKKNQLKVYEKIGGDMGKMLIDQVSDPGVTKEKARAYKRLMRNANKRK